MRSPIFLCMLLLVAAFYTDGEPRVLDSFDSLEGWTIISSDGASGVVRSVPGIKGQALALEYSFHGGSGYVIAQKRLALNLSPDYRFRFFMRGEGPVNNFEFKLLDTADNVYWVKNPDVEFPPEWKPVTIRRRHITFAWGPAHGGEIRHVDRVEFVVSAGTGGGQGRLLIDEFGYEPIDTARAIERPLVRTSSGTPPVMAEGSRDSLLRWAPPGVGPAWMTVDFRQPRELGGVVLEWEARAYAADYALDVSEDGAVWRPVATTRNGNGGRDYLYLPETEARAIRLRLMKAGADAYRLKSIVLKGPEFGSNGNAFYTAIAADAPRGWYPKYFAQVQSYWTIVGAAGDKSEALMNEEGMVETDKASFSLEPFIAADGKLLTWADARCDQSLEEGYLPIPSVRRAGGGFTLAVRAFASGEADSAVLIVTYTLTNTGSDRRRGNLYLALRPFQVNPPTQWLNLQGGAASITSLRYADGVVEVNAFKHVIPLDHPDGFGATTLGGGDIVEYLAQDRLPTHSSSSEPLGFASGALRYAFTLESAQEKEISLAVPFHGEAPGLSPGLPATEIAHRVSARLERTREFWHTTLDRVRFTLPLQARRVEETLKSNLAYILINRDGPAIQPGSRSYDRAWIRDGSLTSASLLQMGITAEVREYLDWYSTYQYASGKIPCVVDARGADPVAEHDSHGEYVFALMQYFRFTRDTAWLRGKFDHLRGAVHYLQELRAQRKTAEYRTGDPLQRACFGLVPESISHEGYSDKPMHSYWDDFFVLRGLKDAAAIASILGDSLETAAYAAERDDFREDLGRSLRLAIRTHGIDYIPGCVELGDFDPTSTAIAICPAGELGWLPEPELHNTFERYYRFFLDRRDGRLQWRNYTPYEIRILGAFVYLGQKRRAHELLDFFMSDRRPPPWNQWAEVVWHEHEPARFIGDMPHTWVGSDFIRAIRSMFAYEQESDSTLVIGAGIPEAWLADSEGVGVAHLPTYYGPLTFRMWRTPRGASVELSGGIDLPPGGVEVRAPLDQPPRAALADGVEAVLERGAGVKVRTLPTRIDFLR